MVEVEAIIKEEPGTLIFLKSNLRYLHFFKKVSLSRSLLFTYLIVFIFADSEAEIIALSEGEEDRAAAAASRAASNRSKAAKEIAGGPQQCQDCLGWFGSAEKLLLHKVSASLFLYTK